MSEENAITRWMQGKKTYFVASTILACGVMAYYGVGIPEFVWAALAALGLGFLRAGVKKGEV